MASRIRITPLMGVGQVGGAVLHIAHGRQGLLVDIGVNLRRSETLLGPTLRPRPSRGLDDWLGLGLIPILESALREDLLPDDFDFEDGEDPDIRAIIPTHGHADHLANLWALNPSIDVHASAITAAMLLSETIAGTGLSGEGTHIVERAPHPSEPGILTRPRRAEPVPRSILLTDSEPNRGLREYWRMAGSDDRLGRSAMKVAGMDLETWAVDHSILGAQGLILHGQSGSVAHCGDLRRHGLAGDLTDRFIRRLVRVRPQAMILEGTRLGRDNDEATSEAQCREAIRGIVRGAGRRLVVASVGPKNIERLAMFLFAARERGRKLVVDPKTMLLLEVVGAASPYHDISDLDGLAVYDPPQQQRPSWHRALRERRAKILVRPEEIKLRPQKYIFMHRFASTLQWRDIEPYGAVYVHSSSGAYSGGAKERLRVTGEWMRLFQMDPKGIRLGKGAPVVDPTLNPSGHLHPSDMADLLRRTKPEILIGVHTERPELFRELLPPGTRLIVPEVGRTIRI